MQAITRQIYITRKTRVPPIYIVQDSAVPIALEFMDYDIPAGASLKAYSKAVGSDDVYSALPSAQGNTVTLVAEPGFFVYGDNKLQVEVNGQIIPFVIDVRCEVRLSRTGTPSTPSTPSTPGGGTGSGEDGGYYIPSVDSAGNLSWTASKTGMSGVPSANIKGPQGPKGDTGPAGRTPVKGTDYWTAAERQAMINDVLNQVPSGGGSGSGTSGGESTRVIFPPVDGWSAHQIFYYGTHSLGTCSFDGGVFTGSATTNKGAGMISPLVDLTDVDILRFEFSASGAVDASTGQFCVYVSSDNQNSDSGRVAEFVASSTEISAGTAIMDVSSLSGEYYIIAGVDVWGSGKSASCTISKVQLEKTADGEDIPFVTPEMFGAVGDGVADDTLALKSAVNSGRSVVGNRAKTYRCKNLTVGDCHMEDLNLVAVEACDYVIKLTTRKSIVRNIRIDGNNVAKVGIYGKINGNSDDLAEVANFTIYNCTEHGVYNADLRCFFRHGFIGECNVGIYNSSSDVKFNDIVVRNAAIAVDGSYYNVTFERIHYWNGLDYSNNSIMFRTSEWDQQSAFFIDCCADTVTYVFDCNSTTAYFVMNNLSWIINTNCYTADMTPPALLKQNKGRISISNSIFINAWKDASGKYPVFFPSDRSAARNVTNSLQNASFSGNPLDWPVYDVLSVAQVPKESSLSELTINAITGTSRERKIAFSFTLPTATYNGEAFTLKLRGFDGVTSLLDGSETVEFTCGSAASSSIPIVLLAVNDGGTIKFISPFSQDVPSTRWLRGVLTINR